MTYAIRTSCRPIPLSLIHIYVDVREDIDAFSKFQFESQFQKISSGGCISYVEIPNLRNNLSALKMCIRDRY